MATTRCFATQSRLPGSGAPSQLCRLITGRLVGDDARRTWAGQCDTRKMLAHDRDQDIDFDALWTLLMPTLDRTDAQLTRLAAEG